MRWIGYVVTILWWSGVVRSLSSLNRGHSYKISPKPCRIPGSTGGTSASFGTCMFVWECIKSEGTHVGVCVDTFMFGSCCVHNETSVDGISTSTLGSTTNRVKSPEDFTQKIATTTNFENVDATGTTLPFVIGASGRPMHKRPQGKPSSEFQEYRPGLREPEDAYTQHHHHHHHHHHPHYNHHHNHNHHQHKEQAKQGTVSGERPNPTKAWSKFPQEVGRPLHRPTDDSFDPGGGSGGIYHSVKDKIDEPSTSNVMKLPGKNQQENVQEALRTRPPVSTSLSSSPPSSSSSSLSSSSSSSPSSSSPSSSSSLWDIPHTHLEAQDSIAHETINQPYLYNRPEEKSTSTYRPISIIDNDRDQHNARPNFISRPETSKKPTKSRTTPKPEIYERPEANPEAQHLTASGPAAQTTHWRVTTEPAFVTKLSTTDSPRPIISSMSSVGSSDNKGNEHFWSEHSWTPPIISSTRPHWSDIQDLLDNEPEKFPNRPSFESTDSQQGSEHEKPVIGAAHYITTDDFGTALTRPRPTRRRKPSPGGVMGATSALLADRTKTRPTAAMSYPTRAVTTLVPITIGAAMTTLDSTTPARSTITTSTTTTTTTSSTSTSTTTTTTSSPLTTTISSTVTTTKKILGSVPTVSAVEEGDSTQCGVPPLFPRPETRIVGGKDAPFGRWPWQVSVRRTSFFGFSSTHRCGGAVLNANWIATAGHCVDDLLTSQIRIRVGDYDFSSVQERLPYVERGIAKKIVHPKYNFFTYEYDLALVRLESALVFAPHISPICLPATDDLLIGENATVTGWGRLSEGGTLPSVLQEVSVPIVSNDRCKSMFLRAGRHEFIPEIFLCAGYETGGQDSCQGDSGGPLQVRGKDGRYFLAGIISWGIGCAEANLPGVCTRISKFVSWILKNVT